MDFPRALAQISEIHRHLAKAEVYRGYRSVPIAASGVVGIAGAWLQPVEAGRDPQTFVTYWSGVALVAAVVGLSEVACNYVIRDHAASRRRTRLVLGQFFPAVFAAAALTFALMRIDQSLASMLPGLWAVCFSLGIFASRPYLPRASALSGLFYFAAGLVLLMTASPGSPLSGWRVAGVFATGQFVGAAVLYWSLERDEIADGPAIGLEE